MAEPSFIDQSKLRFREGEIVFRKGEMAQQMYIILSGKVRMYVSEEPLGDWAEELSKGDFFGEGSLLESLPRQQTAMAIEDTDLIAIMTEQETPVNILLGAQAQQLINQSQIPVLSIHPQEKFTLI